MKGRELGQRTLIISTVILWSLLLSSVGWAGGPYTGNDNSTRTLPYAEHNCVTVDSDLNLSIPCVEYAGSYYWGNLNRYENPTEPFGFYWSLGDYGTTSPNISCGTLDQGLNMICPCVDVAGIYYSVNLDLFGNPGEQGLFWRLGETSIVDNDNINLTATPKYITTEDENIPFISTYEEEEASITLLFDKNQDRINGAVFSLEDNEPVTIYFSQEGFVWRLIIADHILQFANYTDTTVDISVIYPDSSTKLIREAEFGPKGQEVIQSFTRKITSRRTVKSTTDSDRAISMLSKASKAYTALGDADTIISLVEGSVSAKKAVIGLSTSFLLGFNGKLSEGNAAQTASNNVVSIAASAAGCSVGSVFSCASMVVDSAKSIIEAVQAAIDLYKDKITEQANLLLLAQRLCGYNPADPNDPNNPDNICTDNTCRCIEDPCNSGMKWNGSKCVTACRTNEEWDGLECKCIPGTERDGAACVSKCSNGEEWNDAISTCESKCSGGQEWNGSQCVDFCPGGSVWSVSDNACLNICPQGMVWKNSYCKQDCDEGWYWDSEWYACRACPNGICPCEDGMVGTNGRWVCYCPSEDEEWSIDQMKCVPDSENKLVAEEVTASVNFDDMVVVSFSHFDPDGDPIKDVEIGDPSYGRVLNIKKETGTFFYDHTPSATDSARTEPLADNFFYRISDGKDWSGWGLIQVIIEPNKVSECNSLTQAGGDTPETHTVDLGQPEGTLQFSYDTYSQKDRIIVRHQSNVLLDTGCVGASGSRTLSYSGVSPEVTVTVSPNCEGGSGTSWNFTVSCPN